MSFLSSFKLPEDDRTYSWTRHVKQKMIFYGMPASLVKRVIRHPHRTEEGIAPGTIAVMQKARTKQVQEYWVMYADVSSRGGSALGGKKKRIITAWRYPGVSPIREKAPIPQEILEELEQLGEL